MLASHAFGLTRGAQTDHISGQMYSLELANAAVADLMALRAFDRARILAEIQEHLATAPTIEAGQRKLLSSLRPSWEHVPPLWQLRVGDFRVFYDVDEVAQVVSVRRVIRKGSKTTGEVV